MANYFRTLEHLKKIKYRGQVDTIIELMKARLALSIYEGAKSSSLTVNFAFPKEHVYLIEQVFRCKIKHMFKVLSTKPEEPYATILTIKLN